MSIQNSVKTHLRNILSKINEKYINGIEEIEFENVIRFHVDSCVSIYLYEEKIILEIYDFAFDKVKSKEIESDISYDNLENIFLQLKNDLGY